MSPEIVVYLSYLVPPDLSTLEVDPLADPVSGHAYGAASSAQPPSQRIRKQRCEPERYPAPTVSLAQSGDAN